jgi:hypothetical protein
VKDGLIAKRVMIFDSALLDEEVWILFGDSKLVVLRLEGDETYDFLGEVLIGEEYRKAWKQCLAK